MSDNRDQAFQTLADADRKLRRRDPQERIADALEALEAQLAVIAEHRERQRDTTTSVVITIPVGEASDLRKVGRFADRAMGEVADVQQRQRRLMADALRDPA